MNPPWMQNRPYSNEPEDWDFATTPTWVVQRAAQPSDRSTQRQGTATQRTTPAYLQDTATASAAAGAIISGKHAGRSSLAS